jgi:hypothetical protein
MKRRTQLVKHPKYLPGKLAGTFYDKKGDKFYTVIWPRFSECKQYNGNKNPLERNLRASECIVYRPPNKLRKKFDLFILKMKQR